MTTSNIILIGFLLALLSIVSFMLLKHSSKEYPPKEEEIKRPKFKPRKMNDSSKRKVIAEYPKVSKKKSATTTNKSE